MSEIELVMLKCKNCGENLDKGNDHLFFYCTLCNHGNYLSTEDLVPMKTRFFKVDEQLISVNNDFLEERKTEGKPAMPVAAPFWTFNAKLESISIDSSTTLKSIFNSLTGNTRDDSTPAMIRPGSEFLVFVPAYESFLERAKEVGKELTFNWDSLDPVPSSYEPFRNVARKQEDARDIAEFIFLSAVIEHAETIKDLSYELTLENSDMTIISKK